MTYWDLWNLDKYLFLSFRLVLLLICDLPPRINMKQGFTQLSHITSFYSHDLSSLHVWQTNVTVNNVQWENVSNFYVKYCFKEDKIIFRTKAARGLAKISFKCKTFAFNLI